MFRALDVGLLLIDQKRKLVKPVHRAKRRDFISNLQGKQRWNKAKLNYFGFTFTLTTAQAQTELECQVKQS